MSGRASVMSRQTPVPTSTTDWCISALTFSFSTRLPCAISSVWMCERSSKLSGSTIWYSSSIPMVNDGGFTAGPAAAAPSAASSAGRRSPAPSHGESSATASTIQSKFSAPTECGSASGAGFMKSMA